MKSVKVTVQSYSDYGIFYTYRDYRGWFLRLWPLTVSYGGDETGAFWDRPCASCERCTRNQGPDCGKSDHPHCPTCGHCTYRHTEQTAATGAPA